jgi:hypothetical protein
MLIVDPWHWLDKNGDVPADNPRMRRQVLRIARLIEYGGPLQPLHTRETLVECSRRPGGKPCPGLLWVTKNASDGIEASCAVCDNQEIVINNWQETQWAEGMMEPLPLDSTPSSGPESLTRTN